MTDMDKNLNDLSASPVDYHDFEIKIKKLYWIDGSEDNPEDLCLHGDLEIKLNDKIIEYSPTVSAAGIRLLRSLFNDHQAGKGLHLFPCCGNTMIASHDLKKVEILGCDQGLDWAILHEDGLVTIKIDDNTKTIHSYLEYKKEVLDFIDQVENFYKKSEKKVLEEDKDGYLAFWNEWQSLKNKAGII